MTVHLLAGLNGAGKTTFARRLAERDGAVRFGLDEWMLRLHELRYDHPDYAERAEACKDLIWDTALQVLAAGVPVVLDWNQWSRQRRAEWAGRVRAAGHCPVVHYLPIAVETAVARADMRNRGTAPGLAHVLDADAIRHLASIFEPPSSDEGIELHVADVDSQ